MSQLPIQLQEALLDPQTEMVKVGPRPLLARPIVRLASFLVAAGVGLYAGVPPLANVSGLTDEINSRSNPMQTLHQVPQQVKWLEMPSSPFMDAGYRPDGTFSVDRLVGAYKTSGLTVDQAKDVAFRLRALSPVLMGADDPQLALEFQEKAKLESASLLNDYPLQAKKLTTMIQTRTIPTSRSAGVWNTPQNWAGVRSEILISGHFSSDIEDSLAGQPPMSLQEARGHLENAVKITGLRALRVPAISWSSPERLFGLARGLELANADLQDATSWEGQVLGLGGRVILTMGSPPKDSEADGLATARANGYVYIQAQWNNLGHEWIHAVDFIVAQHALKVAGLNTLSEQLKPLRLKKDSAIVEAWRVALWKMVATTPQWQQDLDKDLSQQQAELNANTSNADTNTGSNIRSPGYWKSNEEQLAYAFQGSLNAGEFSILKPFTGGRSGVAMPEKEEAIALAPVWLELFSSMEHLGLSRPMPVEPFLKDRIATRRADYGYNNTRKMAP